MINSRACFKSAFNSNTWNLVIKWSDVTKPSYNKVILLVPALYISLFLYPDEKPRYNKVPLYNILLGDTIFEQACGSLFVSLP